MTEKLTKCPHCGHTGNGLNYAYGMLPFPPVAMDTSQVQACCLACGAHGPFRETMEDAAEAFQAGLLEDA